MTSQQAGFWSQFAYHFVQHFKATCSNFFSFVQPTVLPYSHLFDIDACAQFVSDYLSYQVMVSTVFLVRMIKNI